MDHRLVTAAMESLSHVLQLGIPALRAVERLHGMVPANASREVPGAQEPESTPRLHLPLSPAHLEDSTHCCHLASLMQAVRDVHSTLNPPKADRMLGNLEHSDAKMASSVC